MLIYKQLRYLCCIQNETVMKTIDETRVAALRIIEDAIILKANVFNGCYSDQTALDKIMVRLEAIKKWAIENDQMAHIQHFFAAKCFGHNLQFHAAAISKMFHQ